MLNQIKLFITSGVPYLWEIKSRQTFQCCIIVGKDVQIISIT
jgi:hypothetical protein